MTSNVLCDWICLEDGAMVLVVMVVMPMCVCVRVCVQMCEYMWGGRSGEAKATQERPATADDIILASLHSVSTSMLRPSCVLSH